MERDRAENVTTRLAQVRERIAQACRDADRDPASVRLIAVSKTFGPEEIAPAIAAGQRLFGENRVQESKAKWPSLRATHPALELHLIGPLQSNKVREALTLFDVIHTLDRPSLALALARELRRADSGPPPRLLVQVNTGEEPQKAGVAPHEVDGFLAECRDTHGLAIEGLMCIPPADEPAAPHFALLAKIARRNGLETLSMGMSGDYEAAIALGATYVRVGSAIFGGR
ncbi:YggS family pyridoxal phosphate-dependent enzyme [Ancylobacter dichloromethanicus]|uniref:Pyridoxal phosphate homeostasis protein n=1 Tax=Ancylobacter dichloromethanicus TaxID=518825 RepID=A0A9W6JAC5_9HYPH|nr:YggS family pyridoxal phosphate-dependent enzyme [Ancylobacter dichloromethanicus]MBS7554933.1 YggS family pyridoxal phosphate-dependent enzyme [Ancylobacter dichloromethanicus]GLK73327.1 YggS family pyridoxal phosphate enzyme [Ancylobacter dichloromethanicus]